MKNYWLARVLATENIALSWDLKRVQLLESLIRPTAQFGVDLQNHLGQPSIFHDESIVQDHASGSCDPKQVRAWVYVALLRKAIQDANAVAILESESLWGQAINLWRSLFETDVVCQYVADRPLNDHLACRYVVHSIIRATVLRWEEVNRICCRLGKAAHYTTDEIERRKNVYREQVGKWREDYAWTGEPKHNNFNKVAQATNSDMLFYRIANNEVHPTFGESAMVTGLSLPLPAIPLLPVGITHGAGELSLEFQTAKLLSNTIRRVTDCTTLDSHLQDSVTALKELAETVLRDLSPDVSQ